MAVLKSLEGDEIVISCKCGCDEGIRIRTGRDADDGEIYYQTYLSGKWYKEQAGLIEKIRKIWAIIRNKDFYYSEIVLSEEEWSMYKEWVNKH